jgi:hypothetical protein
MLGIFGVTEELFSCDEGFCSVVLLWTNLTILCVTKLRFSLHFACIPLAYSLITLHAVSLEKRYLSTVIRLRRVRGSVSFRGKEFSSIHGVHIGSGPRPASCTRGTVCAFTGGCNGWNAKLTTYPSLVPSFKISGSWPPFPQRHVFMALSVVTLLVIPEHFLLFCRLS